MGETEVGWYYSATLESLAELKGPGPGQWTGLSPLLISANQLF